MAELLDWLQTRAGLFAALGGIATVTSVVVALAIALRNQTRKRGEEIERLGDQVGQLHKEIVDKMARLTGAELTKNQLQCERDRLSVKLSEYEAANDLTTEAGKHKNDLEQRERQIQTQGNRIFSTRTKIAASFARTSGEAC